MDQVIIKRTKKGVTVYVPNSQCGVFEWILSEGEMGLFAMMDDGQRVVDGQENWNGFEYKG